MQNTVEYYLTSIQYDYLDEGVLSFLEGRFDQAMKAVHKNIDVAKKFLSDHHMNPADLVPIGKRIAHIAKSGHDKGRPAKDTANKITDKVLKPEITSLIKKAKARVDDMSLFGKIISSLFVLAVVVSLSYAALYFVENYLVWGLTTGRHSRQILSMAIMVAGVAPLIEEYGKRIAILKNYPWLYTGMFAALETGIYITKFSSAVGLGTVLVGRALANMMHFATTAIQKWFADREKEKQIMRDPFGEKQPTVSLTGYFAGVAAHAAWNAIPVSMMIIASGGL